MALDNPQVQMEPVYMPNYWSSMAVYVRLESMLKKVLCHSARKLTHIGRMEMLAEDAPRIMDNATTHVLTCLRERAARTRALALQRLAVLEKLFDDEAESLNVHSAALCVLSRMCASGIATPDSICLTYEANVTGCATVVACSVPDFQWMRLREYPVSACIHSAQLRPHDVNWQALNVRFSLQSTSGSRTTWLDRSRIDVDFYTATQPIFWLDAEPGVFCVQVFMPRGFMNNTVDLRIYVDGVKLYKGTPPLTRL